MGRSTNGKPITPYKGSWAHEQELKRVARTHAPPLAPEAPNYVRCHVCGRTFDSSVTATCQEC